jgi:hypothetical protein
LILAIGNHAISRNLGIVLAATTGFTRFPESRHGARVYRADGSEAILGADDALDGEAVLPGFGVTVSPMID